MSKHAGSKNVRSYINPLAVFLTISCVLPACEGFVCSQERIKAIELANKGADEFKNNLYDSAEKDLKQAIQTDPSYEIAYYNLGKVFQKQRKWDKAIESFEQAVQRKPDNANYQYDLGGRIMVQFTIAASGHVIASVLQNSTMSNARVENCTVQAVRRWEFPKPLGGGIVIVSYPFVLTPAGGGE